MHSFYKIKTVTRKKKPTNKQNNKKTTLLFTDLTVRFKVPMHN